MIRLLYALRRQPELSHEAFLSYWLNEHGPKVQAVAEALGIRRYIQLHSITPPEQAQPDAFRGQMQTPFDGVAEFWFDDLESLLEQSPDRAQMDAELVEDEGRFIDHGRSSGWIAYDCPQINPATEKVVATPDSNVVKLFYLLNQPGDLSFDDAQWYWRVQHGPLVRGVADAIQVSKYIQVHRLNHEFNQAFAAGRGTMDSYYGHAELWFDLGQAPHEKRHEAAELLYHDECRFIDFARSASWLNKEHVLVDSLNI